MQIGIPLSAYRRRGASIQKRFLLIDPSAVKIQRPPCVRQQLRAPCELPHTCVDVRGHTLLRKSSLLVQPAKHALSALLLDKRGIAVRNLRERYIGLWHKRQLGFWNNPYSHLYRRVDVHIRMNFTADMCSPDADQQSVSLKWRAEQATAPAAADSPEDKRSFSGSYRSSSRGMQTVTPQQRLSALRSCGDSAAPAAAPQHCSKCRLAAFC